MKHTKKEYKIKKFDKKIEAATRKLSSSGRERKWMRGEKERGWRDVFLNDIRRIFAAVAAAGPGADQG